MTPARLGYLVAGGLLAAILLSLVAIAGLSGAERTVPGVFDDVIKISLGALVGLLAKVGGHEPQPVEVVDQPAQPVPVEPA